jgi:F-type H+-transporting ATPase subunit epsilon
MICDIVTPDHLLFSDEAEFVSAPAAGGEIGFMYLHAPIMSTLRMGEIRVRKPDAEAVRRFAVSGGYIEADGRKVVVLASRAIEVSTVDVEISRERIAHNEKRLTELSADDPRRAFCRDEIAWQNHLVRLAQS